MSAQRDDLSFSSLADELERLQAKGESRELLDALTTAVAALLRLADDDDQRFTGTAAAMEQMAALLEDAADLMRNGEPEECYEITCPGCGEIIVADEDELTEGIACPSCGAKIKME